MKNIIQIDKDKFEKEIVEEFVMRPYWQDKFINILNKHTIKPEEDREELIERPSGYPLYCERHGVGYPTPERWDYHIKTEHCKPTQEEKDKDMVCWKCGSDDIFEFSFRQYCRKCGKPTPEPEECNCNTAEVAHYHPKPKPKVPEKLFYPPVETRPKAANEILTYKLNECIDYLTYLKEKEDEKE